MTNYNNFDFGGKPGVHISVQSSKGNEKFMNKESLGEKLVDGYRVICPVSIAGYFVEPLRPDGTGVKLFYVNRTASNGVPYYLYKRFGASKISSIFDSIIARVLTYEL